MTRRRRHFQVENLNNVATAVKAARGQLYSVHVVNNDGAAAHIQVFDALAANVTLGTTDPDYEIRVAAGAEATLTPAGAGGVHMTNGISVAATIASRGSDDPGAGGDSNIDVYVTFG